MLAAMAEERDGGAPEIRDFWRTMWRHRWLTVLPVLVAVGSAIAYSSAQDPVYEATTDVIIQPGGAQQILGSSSQNAEDAQRNVDTEVAVLKSKVVQDAAKQRLGHTPAVNVSSNPTSDVVSVTARSGAARRAADD